LRDFGDLRRGKRQRRQEKGIKADHALGELLDKGRPARDHIEVVDSARLPAEQNALADTRINLSLTLSQQVPVKRVSLSRVESPIQYGRIADLGHSYGNQGCSAPHQR